MPRTKTTAPLARVKANTDARHLMRFLKFKAGTDPKDIAKSENVSLSTVKDSIRQYEAYVSLNSDGQMQLAIRDLIISTVPQAKATINGLLTAKTFIRKKNKRTGLEEDVPVDDKITQLEAVRVMGGLIQSATPKVPGVAVNVQQNNQTAVLSSTETNEERLRRLRQLQKEHNKLPPEVIGTPALIDSGYDPDEDDGSGDDDDD